MYPLCTFIYYLIVNFIVNFIFISLFSLPFFFLLFMVVHLLLFPFHFHFNVFVCVNGGIQNPDMGDQSSINASWDELLWPRCRRKQIISYVHLISPLSTELKLTSSMNRNSDCICDGFVMDLFCVWVIFIYLFLLMI